MVTQLFSRIRRVQVARLDVSGLDLKFSIKRTLRHQANTCDLTVYNISADHAAQIRNEDNVFVEVAAGYETDGEPTVLFRGIARRDVYVKTQGTEVILEAKARDGGGFTRQRIARSYDRQTPTRRVLEDLITAMGVGRGNIDDYMNDVLRTTSQANFVEGFVANGRAFHIFDRIIRASGNRWSIQNGAIQILRQRRQRTRIGKILSSKTGMIGSPTRDKTGKVTVTVLLQSGLEPGNVVRVESKLIEGDYEIQETNYKGATFGANPDWSATLILKPLTTIVPVRDS